MTRALKHLERESQQHHQLYSLNSEDDEMTDIFEDEEGGEDEADENDGLPPTDRGPDAWRFVLGAGLLEGLGWGLPLSFGIFQAFYSKHELFEASSRSLPMIGTMTAGISHMAMPLISPIVQRFPMYERQICWFGAFLCTASLIAASFATRVWHLIVTQGMMYGLGWVFCYCPFLFMTNEWFVKKRGLAYGIIYSTSGIGGLLLPFLLEKSLATFDFRWTLRLCALGWLVICGPGLPLVKPRIRKTKVGAKPDYGNTSFLKERVFWLFTIAIFFQALGFWLPRFFLPSYAHDLSLTHTQGAFLLALFSVAQIFGQIALGGAADLMTVHVPTSLSTGVCAVAIFLLWGPAKKFGALAFFSMLFGAFGGAFSVLMSLIATKYVTDDASTAMTVFGIFMFERGLGGTVGGPVSTLLLGTETDLDAFGLQKYSGIVWFVGLGMALSCALVCLAYLLRRRPRGSPPPAPGNAANKDRLQSTSASAIHQPELDSSWAFRQSQELEQQVLLPSAARLSDADETQPLRQAGKGDGVF